jgi:hypothetical protein
VNVEQPTVGGWTQAYCTTCRDMREHVVVAMVSGVPAKVECTSCHKQHAFRSGPPGDKKEAARKTGRLTSGGRARKAPGMPTPAPPIDMAERMAGKIPGKYDPQHAFAVDDVVEHPSFGKGVVTCLPGPQKMEVLFESGPKVLSHDRGGQKAPSLQRPPPRDDEAGPKVSDAPPAKAR